MAKITQMRAKALFISPTPALSPLLQAQGIPHMRELGKLGMEFTLLTFEHRDWSEQDKKRAETLRATLAGWGIDWHILRYGRLPFVPNSTIDVFRGAAYALKLIRRKGIEVVHCRSYVPAYMCLMLRRLTGIKFIFDMRGFLPDEYVEGGHWTMDRWEYKLAKRLEAKCLRAADGIVVTSERMRETVLAGANGPDEAESIDGKLSVIPNLADLSRFEPDDEKREAMRARHGLSDRIVFLWLVGGITKPHMPEEIVRFFLTCKESTPNARLLILTGTRNADAMMLEAGLSPDDFLAYSVPPEDVVDYILMGDLGMNFCDPAHPGSAIKLAEYLGCGLPLVINWAVENAVELTQEANTGVIVEAFDVEAYRKAAGRIVSLLADREGLKARCREVAQQRYCLRIAVDKYAEVYNRLLG